MDDEFVVPTTPAAAIRITVWYYYPFRVILGCRQVCRPPHHCFQLIGFGLIPNYNFVISNLLLMIYHYVIWIAAGITTV